MEAEQQQNRLKMMKHLLTKSSFYADYIQERIHVATVKEEKE